MSCRGSLAQLDRKALDRAFNPRCVAVVGDKTANGYVWLRNMSTFTGRLYSVQIDPNELRGIEQLGVKNYGSLLDIPGPVDYVVVAVPRAVAAAHHRRLHPEGGGWGFAVHLRLLGDAQPRG